MSSVEAQAASSESSRTHAARLLERVCEIAPQLEAVARQAEIDRTLPRETFALLRDADLLWLKTAAELGGLELDPPDFCDVLELLAYHDASAAWAVMVANGATGVLSGLMSTEGAAQVFGSERPVVAGQFAARGHAVRQKRGYVVTGRWSFSSGIEHANWVTGGFRVLGSDTHLCFCLPKREVEVHDVWHVVGLQGTGSNDFSIEDHFVPEALVVVADGATVRGGPLFRQPHRVFVGNEVPAVSVGIARRAFDDMVELARGTKRRRSAASIADRPAFQKALGQFDARWAAARAVYREAVSDTWALARGEGVDRTVEARFMSRTSFTVAETVCCVADIFPYAGGRALALSNPLQRHYRDLIATGQHLSISEENFERYGSLLV